MSKKNKLNYNQIELGFWQGVLNSSKHELMLLISLIILLITFGVSCKEFLTLVNLLNIARQSSITILLALGMTVVIINAGIDLSVGSVASLISVIVVRLSQTLSIPIALILGLVAGGCIGIINGIIISKFKVPDFIVTIAMMNIARGLAFIISGGYAIQFNFNKTFTYLYNGKIGPISFPIIMVIVMGIMMHFILSHTKFGRSFYAVGGNRRAAYLAGLNVGLTTVFAYLISGIFTGFGGLIAASRMAAGSPTIGMGWELIAISIVILGGTNLFGGEGRILGTILAGLLIGMINNWMSLTGLSWCLQGFVQGSLLIIVVIFNQRSKAKEISSSASRIR